MNTKESKRTNESRTDLTTPFFSIIIPCYNSAEKLTILIDSINGQPFDDYEIIVVDDGSKESELQTLFLLKRKYKHIRLFFNATNTGPLYSRIKGQKESLGEYLLFFDSDDVVLSNSLCSLKSFLIANECDVVFYNVLLNEKNVYKPFLNQVIEFDVLFYNLLVDCLSAPLWNKCFNSKLKNSFDYEVVERYQNVRFGDDMLHSYLFYKHANVVLFSDIELYYHINNKDGLSSSYLVSENQNKLTLNIALYVYENMKYILSKRLFEEAVNKRLCSLYDMASVYSKRSFLDFYKIIRSTVDSPFYKFLKKENVQKLKGKYKFIDLLYIFRCYLFLYVIYRIYFLLK